MILCVYHGSTYKGVNELQTALITRRVSEHFTNQQVIPCYYSKPVLDTMKRREIPLVSFTDVLTAEYASQRQIYVLITNMINGYEYQKILSTIAEIDFEHKVYITEYLLSEQNVYNFADCIVNKNNPTLFVGHGTTTSNRDYARLNELLKDNGNVVSTLDSELKPVMDQHFISKRLIVRPLMFTSGYHVKNDIEQTVVIKLKQLGYKPIVDLRPLCHNSRVIDFLIANLAELIEETESKL